MTSGKKVSFNRTNNRRVQRVIKKFIFPCKNILHVVNVRRRDNNKVEQDDGKAEEMAGKSQQILSHNPKKILFEDKQREGCVETLLNGRLNP